jgi:hypothetical protein
MPARPERRGYPSRSIVDELDQALAQIASRPGCRLPPPNGQAIAPVGMMIPTDLRRLHELCGGAILFEGAPFEWRVSGPQELVTASPRP